MPVQNLNTSHIQDYNRHWAKSVNLFDPASRAKVQYLTDVGFFVPHYVQLHPGFYPLIHLLLIIILRMCGALPPVPQHTFVHWDNFSLTVTVHVLCKWIKSTAEAYIFHICSECEVLHITGQIADLILRVERDLKVLQNFGLGNQVWFLAGEEIFPTAPHSDNRCWGLFSQKQSS
jgi:hypothetical protein